MGLHTVGKLDDRSADDGNPAEHGRDTCVYQELQPVRREYRKWLTGNINDLFNDELLAKAAKIEELLDAISDELNTPI